MRYIISSTTFQRVEHTGDIKMESTMSTINKELYDALIEAKVGEETATKAAMVG